ELEWLAPEKLEGLLPVARDLHGEAGRGQDDLELHGLGQTVLDHQELQRLTRSGIHVTSSYDSGPASGPALRARPGDRTEQRFEVCHETAPDTWSFYLVR